MHVDHARRASGEIHIEKEGAFILKSCHPEPVLAEIEHIVDLSL
jgi:hypothetical protein